MYRERLDERDYRWHEQKPGWDAGIREIAFRDDHLFWRSKGDRGFWRYDYPRCELHVCDMCKRLQSKRRCQYAWFDYMRELPPVDWRSPRVCIGCAAKVRAVCRRYRDFLDLRCLTNKLKKAVGDARKKDDHWQAASDAHAGD